MIWIKGQKKGKIKEYEGDKLIREIDWGEQGNKKHSRMVRPVSKKPSKPTADDLDEFDFSDSDDSDNDDDIDESRDGQKLNIPIQSGRSCHGKGSKPIRKRNLMIVIKKRPTVTNNVKSEETLLMSGSSRSISVSSRKSGASFSIRSGSVDLDQGPEEREDQRIRRG